MFTFCIWGRKARKAERAGRMAAPRLGFLEPGRITQVCALVRIFSVRANFLARPRWIPCTNSLWGGEFREPNPSRIILTTRLLQDLNLCDAQGAISPSSMICHLNGGRYQDSGTAHL